MGALLALLLLTCPDAPGVQGVPCRNGTPNRIRATSGLPMRKTDIGVGMAAAIPLCTAMQAGDLAGAWWCLNGDGTMQAGSSTTLSPAGAPAVESWPVCPSSTGCTFENQTVLNPTTVSPASQWYVSPVVAAPTGSFTTCAVGSVDGVNKAAAAGPIQAAVWYLTTRADLNGSWGIQNAQSGGATGLTTTATGVVNVDSAVPAQARTQMFICGVFQASTLVKSCTFIPGLGMTCVSTGHASANIDLTARKWVVGARRIDGVNDDVWHGLFRGAFFTEKALSTADMTRIAVANLPPTPSSITFARASPRSCCFGGQCTVIPINVPCISGNHVSLELIAGQNRDQSSEAVSGTWSAGSEPVDVPHDPTLVANAGQSIFGMTTADSVVFPATTFNHASDDAGFSSFIYPPYVTTGGLAQITQSIWIKGIASSGVLDFCLFDNNPAQPPPMNGYHCTTCSYSATWTRCSYTYSSLSANPVVGVLGNLSRWARIDRSIASVYVFAGQAEIQPAVTSYINTQHTGTATIRAAETCVGTGC